MDSLGGLNPKVVIALAVAWILTGLVLVKGVKMIGKISGFTATVPYVIIVILFIRGVTLDGARIGMDFYLLKPDMSVIWDADTWRAAATHVCYSLAIGFGCSYNYSSRCFHEHVWGTAVFSVLGFMSKQLDTEIGKVVQSGTGLAFIAYPEAMSRMPLPWLWSLLFFLMLFILGISSQFGLAEVAITALYDQCPSLRKHKTFVAIGVCITLFFSGLIMTTRAGIYYFNIFNDYSASFSLMMLIILEIILIIYIYGIDNYILDLRSMMGEPKNWLTKIFGPSGQYVKFIWRFIAPFQSVIIFVVTLVTQITRNMTYGKDKRLYTYPDWAILVGWVISLVPLFMLPGLVVYNLAKFKKQGRSYKELFRLQPKWTSYERNTKNGSVMSISRVQVAPMTDPVPLNAVEAWRRHALVGDSLDPVPLYDDQDEESNRKVTHKVD
uniref:Uncharacterized protein n=1 Tax=Ditylenchus dipsaci TaxID=166011 RepID=A0A915D528_9BILA